MVVLGGGLFLMSEVPLYRLGVPSGPHPLSGEGVKIDPQEVLGRSSSFRLSRRPCFWIQYRGYSTLRTRTAPRVVLCS
jgi:hypothetical protein